MGKRRGNQLIRRHEARRLFEVFAPPFQTPDQMRAFRGIGQRSYEGLGCQVP
jgi:hypothetical protein